MNFKGPLKYFPRVLLCLLCFPIKKGSGFPWQIPLKSMGQARKSLGQPVGAWGSLGKTGPARGSLSQWGEHRPAWTSLASLSQPGLFQAVSILTQASQGPPRLPRLAMARPGSSWAGPSYWRGFKKQLKDKDNKSSEKIFRKCVHCGFCNATCPTYDLLGDELDGPRGRIYMIKDMLENNKLPNEKVVKHIDRCLSCYSCMTTCPSGVNYMHLVDHARNYIEKNYKRSFFDRLIRSFLSIVLPNSTNFWIVGKLALFVKPFKFIFPKFFITSNISNGLIFFSSFNTIKKNS